MKLLRVGLLIVGIASILFAAGCGGGQAVPTPVGAAKEVTPTDAPEPTTTSAPTDTSVPTSTPIPTLVPTATPMPVPTATPLPTATPTPVPTPVFDATYYRLQGMSYGLGIESERKLAIESFDKAIELDPNMSGAYHGRCNYHLWEGQNLSALKDCDKAIELDGNQADYYRVRQQVYHSLSFWKLSVQDLEKWMKLDPNSNRFAPSNNEKLYLDNRENIRALKGIEEETRSRWFLIPYGSEPSKQYQSYLRRGNNYLMTGQFVNSIEDYGKAIELIDMITSENRKVKHALIQGQIYYNRSLSYYFLHEFDLYKNDAMKACAIDKSLCGMQPCEVDTSLDKSLCGMQRGYFSGIIQPQAP